MAPQKSSAAKTTKSLAAARKLINGSAPKSTKGKHPSHFQTTYYRITKPTRAKDAEPVHPILESAVKGIKADHVRASKACEDLDSEYHSDDDEDEDEDENAGLWSELFDEENPQKKKITKQEKEKKQKMTKQEKEKRLEERDACLDALELEFERAMRQSRELELLEKSLRPNERKRQEVHFAGWNSGPFGGMRGRR